MIQLSGRGVIIMPKNKIDMKTELRKFYYDFHFLQMIDCSNNDNKKYKQMQKNSEPLPDGVYEYKSVYEEKTGVFYTVYDPGLSQNEKIEYLLFTHLNMLRTVKNCILFLTLTSIITTIVMLFSHI